MPASPVRPTVLAAAAGLDAALLLVFVLIGRANHNETLLGALGTWWPFLTGLVVGWLVMRAWRHPLTIVWTGAAAGVALKMFWPSAPRWVGVPLYLLLGYVAVLFAEVLLQGAGVAVVALLVAGAVLYNIGAVLYGTQWPNPWPSTFGHHEFFHAFTVAGAICHFAAIWLVVG